MKKEMKNIEGKALSDEELEGVVGGTNWAFVLEDCLMNCNLGNPDIREYVDDLRTKNFAAAGKKLLELDPNSQKIINSSITSHS